MDHLTLLAEQQHRFAVALQAADPTAAVPSCAPWVVADLALHLCGIHAWATDLASGERRDVARYEPSGPRDAAGLVALYRTRAAELHGQLAALDQDASCRTLTGAGTTAFWRRRQLHETALHGWDLESVGPAPGPAPYDPLVAADGVDEVVTMFAPRQVALERIPPLPASVTLVATDTEGSWTIGEGAPVATVSATAESLLLALWHRTPASTLTVDGDAAAAHGVLALALTP